MAHMIQRQQAHVALLGHAEDPGEGARGKVGKRQRLGVGRLGHFHQHRAGTARLLHRLDGVLPVAANGIELPLPAAALCREQHAFIQEQHAAAQENVAFRRPQYDAVERVVNQGINILRPCRHARQQQKKGHNQ